MGLVRLAKVLIQYGKEGRLRFLSHLELVRAFERSFRRANIDVLMSGGFNPRPKISYGPALPVGAGSYAEYMIVDLKNPVPENQLLEKLSSVLPKGLSIYKAKYISEKQGSITSLAQSVAYSIRVKFIPGSEDASDPGIEPFIDKLMNQEKLSVKHKEGRKWVETNQAIIDWRVERKSDGIVDFYLLLSVGNINSVRPENAVGVLPEMFPHLGRVEVKEIFRLQQYINRDDPLINIYEFYESVKMGSEHYKS